MLPLSAGFVALTLLFGLVLIAIVSHARRSAARELLVLSNFARQHDLVYQRKLPHGFRKAWAKLPDIVPSGTRLNIHGVVYGTLHPDDVEITLFTASAVMVMPGGAVPFFRTVLSTEFQHTEDITIRRRSAFSHLDPHRVITMQDADFEKQRHISAKNRAEAVQLINQDARRIIIETDLWWERYRRWDAPGHPTWIIARGRLILALPVRPNRFPLEEALVRLLNMHDALLTPPSMPT